MEEHEQEQVQVQELEHEDGHGHGHGQVEEEWMKMWYHHYYHYPYYYYYQQQQSYHHTPHHHPYNTHMDNSLLAYYQQHGYTLPPQHPHPWMTHYPYASHPPSHDGEETVEINHHLPHSSHGHIMTKSHDMSSYHEMKADKEIKIERQVTPPPSLPRIFTPLSSSISTSTSAEKEKKLARKYNQVEMHGEVKASKLPSTTSTSTSTASTHAASVVSKEGGSGGGGTRKAWTPIEDKRLIQIVTSTRMDHHYRHQVDDDEKGGDGDDDQNGNSNNATTSSCSGSVCNTTWEDIAAMIEGRSAKQCRERWVEYLDPSIDFSPFSEEEDQLILDMQSKHGNKWRMITEKLTCYQQANGSTKCRTPTAIKTRFNYLQRHFQRSIQQQQGATNHHQHLPHK